MWFDSHCHLHLCEHDSTERIIARAHDAGVDSIVAVGIDVASSARSLMLARAHGLYATAGLHPNSAGSWDVEVATAIGELLEDDLVVAVGETGLDFFRDSAPPDAQLAAFEAHIDLAKQHDKALVVHTRDSVAAAVVLLERLGPPGRLVFHCWSGGTDDLRRALDLGAHISFAGNVSFRNAPELRDAAAAVPADRLMIETDSPFLSPEPRRGRPNEPGGVALVGAAVAAARGEEPAEVAAITSRNSLAVYTVDP